MQIIDIDLDFFLNQIATHQPYNDERLIDGGIIPWEEKDVRFFLENNCGLSEIRHVDGRRIKHHSEAFFFWRELLQKNQLTVPFDVVHIDAHADLGGWDAGWAFIFEEVLRIPLEERADIEKFQYRNDAQRLNSGNYLLYALAAHWISSITLICHPNWEEDYPSLIMKDFNDKSGFIQLKRFPQKIDFGLLSYNGTTQKYQGDQEIPFNIVRDYHKYRVSSSSQFDFLNICQSPSYTPASADYILEIIEDYINPI